MKKFILILIVLIARSSFARQAGTIEKTTCFLKDCSFADKNPNVEFGYLYVPENYSDSTSPLRKMAFVIIKNTKPDRKPDPLMIFEGGWGIPNIEAALEYYTTQSFLQKDRDIILFDYRGCGLSEPTLCPWVADSVASLVMSNLDYGQVKKKQIEFLNGCLDSLQARNIDFNSYGTNNKGRDIALLAEKLGYPEYNLFGVSYGTRNILSFIRYAKVKVRSVVLDSNLPIGYPYEGNQLNNYANTLNSIFSDCENDPDCNKRFPDLKQRFITFLQTLDKENFMVVSYNNDTFYINKEEINAILHQSLYESNQYKDMPLFIESIISRDPNPWLAIAPQMIGRLKDFSRGLGFINAVYDYKPLQQEEKRLYETSVMAYKDYNLYQPFIDYKVSDNRFGFDSLDAMPVSSDVRALILAGTYDPTSPPASAKFLLNYIPNHYYFEFPRVGHGVVQTACARSMVLQFLNDPTQKPADSCLQQMGENKIHFTTAWYKNSRIGIFTIHLFWERSIWLYAALGIVVLVCIINLIRAIVLAFSGKGKTKRPLMTITSLLTLTFLGGFGYFVQQTSAQENFLILFGLLKNANYIFYLVPLIFVLTAILGLQIFRRRDFKVLPVLTLVAMLIFCGLAGYYQLFPNIS